MNGMLKLVTESRPGRSDSSVMVNVDDNQALFSIRTTTDISLFVFF